MNSRMLAGALAAVAIGACSASDGQGAASEGATLAELWSADGFSAPESVIVAADGERLYVSNVAGEGDERDGEGFISLITRAGEIVALRWVDGLDAPKGMALANGRLYVSDIDRLVEIDPASGEIARAIPVEGARFLNDVAATPDGRVFVSDSGTGAIHELVGDGVETFFHGDGIAGVNGLLPDGGRLLVTSMDAGELAAIDFETRALTVLAGGMDDADGIARAPGGGYVVTSWPGTIWFVGEGGGAPIALIDRTSQEIYMNDILLDDGVLYVPHWRPGTVSAHRWE